MYEGPILFPVFYPILFPLKDGLYILTFVILLSGNSHLFNTLKQLIMKRISIAINCLLIGVILFQACNSSKVSTDNTRNSCSRCNEYSRADLTGMISYATAKKLSSDYVQDAGKKFIGKGAQITGEQDSRNVWFSLPKLKAYISFIEQQTCLSGCDKRKELGVRVYFGKYPDSITMKANPSLDGVPRAFQNHHTVFFSATYYDPQKKINIDFDPTDVIDNCALYPINPVKGRVWIAVPAAGSAEGDRENHGGLMPPPAGKGSFPTTGDN